MFILKLMLITVVCEQVFLINMVTWSQPLVMRLNCHVTFHRPPLRTSRGSMQRFCYMGHPATFISMLMVILMRKYAGVSAFTTPMVAITVWRYWILRIMIQVIIAVITNSWW